MAEGYDPIFGDGSTAKSAWRTRGARDAVIINVLGGLLVGYTIGYVPIAIQYESYVSNCTRYTGPDACTALHKFSTCRWLPARDPTDDLSASNAPANLTAQCLFENEIVFDKTGAVQPEASVPCAAYRDSASCSKQTNCYYQEGKDVCVHDSGWSAVQDGIFAAMPIIGSTMGSPLAGQLLLKIGRRKTLGVVGILSVVAVGLQSIAWVVNSYPIFTIARFLVGAGMGMASVICPMYCGEVAPLELQEVLGVFFQLFLTLGIFLASLVGLAISPRNDTVDDAHLRLKFQVLNLLNFVIAVALVPAACIVQEPDVSTRMNDVAHACENGACGDPGLSAANSGATKQSKESPYDEDPDSIHRALNAHHGENGEGTAEDSFSSSSPLWILLWVAVAMSGAQQLTGINAIMNYAPTMMEAAGLPPLTGNCVIMAWNFVATCGSIPIAKRFGTRSMYLTSALVASIACLLTGIPTYPGVIENDSARHTLVILGILTFVAAFECGLGPAFYVLAQSIFPRRYRNFGCTFANTTQFAFNVVIVFSYPVAQVALSGGKSGNQNRGQAIAFLAFGVLGFLCTAFLVKFLPKPSA